MDSHLFKLKMLRAALEAGEEQVLQFLRLNDVPAGTGYAAARMMEACCANPVPPVFISTAHEKFARWVFDGEEYFRFEAAWPSSRDHGVIFDDGAQAYLPENLRSAGGEVTQGRLRGPLSWRSLVIHYWMRDQTGPIDGRDVLRVRLALCGLSRAEIGELFPMIEKKGVMTDEEVATAKRINWI